MITNEQKLALEARIKDLESKDSTVQMLKDRTIYQCERIAELEQMHQDICDIAEASMAKCRELEAEVLSKEGMALVTKEDAENYCRILSLLGMEEEGSPIEGVEHLISLRDGMTCGDCNDTGWLENREEGRYPCTCMTEAEPYQILVAERDALAITVQQMREALEVVNVQLIEGKIFTQQMHKRPYWRYSVSEALTLPDTSEIIKRHDAAVLFNAAKNLRLSEGSVTPFYNSMRTAIEQVEIMAHELDKS